MVRYSKALFLTDLNLLLHEVVILDHHGSNHRLKRPWADGTIY